MGLVHKLINDPDTESLIRKYLNAGVMVEVSYEQSLTGTPQGGNLSPLLSNIILNELDKELEARGLHFVRYADDCVIAVGSSAAANRVMATVTKWIERKLSLKVNMTKTKVTRPNKLKYLGFGFWKGQDGWKARPHQDSIQVHPLHHGFSTKNLQSPFHSTDLKKAWKNSAPRFQEQQWQIGPYSATACTSSTLQTTSIASFSSENT